MGFFKIRWASVSRARLVRSLVKSSRPHDPYELTATSHDMRMPLAHAHTLPAPLLRQTNSFGVGVVEKRHGGDTFPRNGGSCSRHHSLNICQPWGKFITFRRGVRVTGPGPGGLTAAVRGSFRGVISEKQDFKWDRSLYGSLKSTHSTPMIKQVKI